MAELTLGVEGGELVPGPGTNGQTDQWPVCVVGFTTASMAVALAIYKAPSGVFGDHKIAYYVSVLSAGVLGLAEVLAAIKWMSGPHQPAQHPHGRARRCVLYGSLVPLAFVAGLGGVRLLFKYRALLYVVGLWLFDSRLWKAHEATNDKEIDCIEVANRWGIDCIEPRRPSK